MIDSLSEFLKNSLTQYHTCENAAKLLTENGFEKLSETEDWNLCEGGKYFVVRNESSLIAFTLGTLDAFSFKIAASHTDSPAMKLKENPLQSSNFYTTLNVETYGGGIYYSFLDRPLKIAGRVIKRDGDTLRSEIVEAPYFVTIPSLAIHQNRAVNDGFAINPQIDLQPLFSMKKSDNTEKNDVVSYDLYLANADAPYLFGANGEFIASPRLDNLVGAYASLQALLTTENANGVCVAALFDNEEVGSLTAQGADGDFLANTLRRISYALRFDDNEHFKALASSFLLSVDNAHAVHPNHPEKSDTTNKAVLGGGVVIKNHANKAYITDAMSSAIVKTVFEKADVKYQAFFNRSDVRSGSTLGAASIRHVGMRGADIGIAQLAMHSACECCAIEDLSELTKGLTAFYQSNVVQEGDEISIL